MKSKLLKITILTIILITYLQTYIFANSLKLNLKADKEELEIGEEVKITVSWNEGMQAADFSLLYDSKKIEYVSSELPDDFINSTEGELKTAWVSLDNTDRTQIEYTFKAKNSGKVKISTQINGGFATGELQIPEEYENAELTVKVAGGINIVLILLIVCVLAVIILVAKSKKKNRKK